MKKILKLKAREIIDLLIEFSYLAIIFIVPIYFSIVFPTYNFFELGKLFFFKIFIWLLFFLTVIKLVFFYSPGILSGRSLKEKHSFLKKYFLVPFLFILGLGMSLFFSINRTQSFFGSYDRQSGFLSYLFYFFGFILIVFNVLTIKNSFSREESKDRLAQKVNRMVVAMALSGLVVAIYGILQILGIDFLSWPEDPLLTKRTFSTFGQPNFLASWLLLVIPLSAYLFYKNKKTLLRFFYFLVFFAQLACLFFTSSRGGLLAFGFVCLLFIVYLIFFTKLKKTYKIFICSSFSVVLISGFVAVNILSPGRFSSLLDIKSGSLAARINFYSAAYDAIIKKPIFGYGLDNGGEVFISYYQPDWGIYGDVSATTDRAHNIFLDIVLASGLFGLTFFIILYYYFFRLAYNNIKHKKMGALSLALSLGAAGYLTSLMFSFPCVAGEIYFWIFLAVLTVIDINQEKLLLSEKERLPFRLISYKTLLVFTAFIIFCWGARYEFGVLSADYYFNRLYYVLAEEQYFTAFVLDDYIAAAKTNPVNEEYYNLFIGEKLSDFYPTIKELSSQKVVREKLVSLDGKLKERGYENIYVKGKINFALENYSVAEKYFSKIMNLTPYWPKVYIDFGSLLVKEGKIKEAIINYWLLENILPEVEDNRLNDPHRKKVQLYRRITARETGNIYFNLGEYSEAEKYYQLAYESGLDDFTLLKNIANTYYLRGDFQKALEYNKRGLKRNPNDYSWYLSTALIYKETGNMDEAKNYFNDALKLSPENETLLKMKEEY